MLDLSSQAEAEVPSWIWQARVDRRRLAGQNVKQTQAGLSNPMEGAAAPIDSLDRGMLDLSSQAGPELASWIWQARMEGRRE